MAWLLSLTYSLLFSSLFFNFPTHTGLFLFSVYFYSSPFAFGCTLVQTFWYILFTLNSNYDNVEYEFSHLILVFVFITLTTIRVWDDNQKPNINKCQNPKRSNGKGNWKPQKFFLTSDITVDILSILNSRFKVDIHNYLMWAPTSNRLETWKFCKGRTASYQFQWSYGRK